MKFCSFLPRGSKSSLIHPRHKQTWQRHNILFVWRLRHDSHRLRLLERYRLVDPHLGQFITAPAAIIRMPDYKRIIVWVQFKPSWGHCQGFFGSFAAPASRLHSPARRIAWNPVTDKSLFHGAQVAYCSEPETRNSMPSKLFASIVLPLERGTGGVLLFQWFRILFRRLLSVFSFGRRLYEAIGRDPRNNGIDEAVGVFIDRMVIETQ